MDDIKAENARLKARISQLEAEKKRDRDDIEKLNAMCLEWMDAGVALFEQTGAFVNNANKGRTRQDAFNKLLTPMVLKLKSEKGKRPTASEVLRCFELERPDILQEIDYEEGRFWLLNGKEGGYTIKALGDRIATILNQREKK